MHLLGHHLADHKPVRIALRAFFGVGHNTSQRICARLQIHHHCKVEQLTEPQITALSAYLSSTSTAAAAIQTPLAAPPLPPKCMRYEPPSSSASAKSADPLDTLKIETDLKKQVAADIAHLKAIGTYRGRRLTAGLPSRGQRTKTNARTARKLNDKRRYTTMVSPSASMSSSIPSFSSRPFSSSNVLAALRTLQL